MGASTSEESSLVQRFIHDNQARLVQRALSTLATAQESELAFQFHRLAGALGSYQLLDTARMLLEFEQLSLQGSATPDVLRARALEELHRLDATLSAAA